MKHQCGTLLSCWGSGDARDKEWDLGAQKLGMAGLVAKPCQCALCPAILLHQRIRKQGSVTVDCTCQELSTLGTQKFSIERKLQGWCVLQAQSAIHNNMDLLKHQQLSWSFRQHREPVSWSSAFLPLREMREAEVRTTHYRGVGLLHCVDLAGQWRGPLVSESL